MSSAEVIGKRLLGRRSSFVAIFNWIFLLGTFLQLGGEYCVYGERISATRLPFVVGIFGLGGNDKQHTQDSASSLTTQKIAPVPKSLPYDPPRELSVRPVLTPPPPPPPSLIEGGHSSFTNNKERPPPPRPNSIGENNETLAGNGGQKELDKRLDNTNIGTKEEAQKVVNPPPPPPTFGWGSGPNTNRNHPPDQQYFNQPFEQQDPWQPHYFHEHDAQNERFLQGQIQDVLARERDLLFQLDNLTGTILTLEQREELHVRQFDLLTERFIDLEAQAAQDRNRVVEIEANCTALGKTISSLQGELGMWQQRCDDLAKWHEVGQEKVETLQKLLKERENEVEELAIAIENLRLAERRDGSKSRRTRRGLLSWMSRLFGSSGEGFEDMKRKDAYQMAKSTLIRALQSERGNVQELEAMVLSLQQNNTAISEMVEARDSVINELNSRITAFEEDKVVLQAALRQLRKEIKEEAPKAKKLSDELSKAQKETDRLREEMNGLVQTHQDEVLALQRALLTKQQEISDTESNLTSIGTYVDKLEERLTSFAVTRRDIEEREKKCRDIEEKADTWEEVRKALQKSLDEVTKERQDLRHTLESLNTEKTNLQNENRKLNTEREFRTEELNRLQGKCDALVNETASLSEHLLEWKTKCNQLSKELETERESRGDLKIGTDREIESFQRKCDELQDIVDAKQQEVIILREENERLQELAKNQCVGQRKSVDEMSFETQVKEAHSRKPRARRYVPLRSVRKQFAKRTGIHGLFRAKSVVDNVGSGAQGRHNPNS